MKTFAALVVVLVLALNANAQTPATTAAAAAPTTTPTCEILKVLKGEVVEAGKDFVPFVVKTKGCETEIKELVADGLEFSDLAFKPGRITAKVKATTTASTGTTSFKLVDKDDNETKSPDSVFLLILDASDSYVKAVADKAMSATAVTSKKVAALETKVETVSTSRPTRDEVISAISPLQARITELEKVVGSMKEELTMANNRVASLGAATASLADNQATLANTKVKKGFWGKKPLNPEAAAEAERVKADIFSIK